MINREYVGFDSRSEWHSAELAALVAAGVVQSPVMDLGCGHGSEALFLAAQGMQVRAIDRDGVALSEANRRRSEMTPAQRRRVRFVRGNALTTRGVKEGSFGAVVERLLLTNLDRESGLRLLRVAAHALRPGGALLLRHNLDGEVAWGRLPTTFLPKRQREFLAKYFGKCRPIAFMGVVTDPLLTDRALVARPHAQALLVARRNRVRISR